MSSIHSVSTNSQASEKKEPPSSGDSMPAQAFGAGSQRYHLFLEALFDGLLGYGHRCV
jgi:hypothetical protein